MAGDHARRVGADEFQFLIADAADDWLSADVGDGVEVLSYTTEIPEWIIVQTGAHWGPVEVRAEVRLSPPPVGEEWEEVVEVSVRCASGLVVRELGGAQVLTICDRGGRAATDVA